MWFELHWPRTVEADRLVQVLRLLAAAKAAPVVLEAVGVRGAVVHRIALPSAAAQMLLEQIRAALPAIGILRLGERPSVMVDQAVEIRLSTAARPLAVEHDEAVSKALLTALSWVRGGESIVLQWQLVGSAHPAPVESDKGVSSPSAWSSKPLDAEARGSLRQKRALPGWRIVGRIGAHAQDPPRQRQLIQQVTQALRSAEAPGVRFGFRTINPQNLVDLRKPWLVPTRLNISELAVVSGFPIGETAGLPVVRQTSRPLAAPSAVASSGRLLGVSTYPGRERPVALGVRESLRGLHLLGPTGSGKSTLALRLICQDMGAGRSVVVIEPKGDLITDVLARVPADRLDDVVLIDPTDREAVVGINPLAVSRDVSELVADRLLHVFHQTYASSWGPRTSDILYAALLTLARTPGMSLASLPLLLSDPNFRRHVLGKLDEPIVLQPFWQAFEAWSEAERQTAIAPAMNKIRPLLVRPSLRAMLGQASPRFDLRQLFTQRKVLLVNLAKGLIGPEGAALLGGVVIAQLWQLALERSAIAAEGRRPVFMVVDEFQDFLALPTDLADVLAQARGLGVGLTLAHQHLGQLNPQMRSAVLSNARSRVVFQVAGEDARALAADSQLAPDDFRSLGAFEAYAQLVAGDAVQPWLSLRTEPAPGPCSDPDAVRSLSRRRYATAVADVDLELGRLRNVGRSAGDLGPRRRIGGEA